MSTVAVAAAGAALRVCSVHRAGENLLQNAQYKLEEYGLT